MRRNIMMILAMTLTASGLILAQQKPVEKPVRMSGEMRLKLLEVEKGKLRDRIREEDGRRNRNVPGVSAEAMERVNDHQDSICLALRSKMVDLTLEMEELTESGASQSTMSATIVDYLNGNKVAAIEEKE